MIKRIYYIVLLSFLVASCASVPKEYKDMDKAVGHHNFEEALEVIEKGQQKKIPLYSERNAILLFLNKGILEHYAGNYEESAKSLQTAERLIEEAYTKSITQGFLSYIANDNTREYPGEDFEDIYINIFNALNYYHKGNMEGALVEVRKLTIPSGKLHLLARKYEYRDPNTGAGLNEMMQKETGISQMPETKTTSFSNSALARYLSFLFYQGIGNYDAARIEYQQIYRAFNTNRNIYNFNVPSSIEDANNVPRDKARLNVISFTGLSPIKHEEKITHYLPFSNPAMRVAVFKLPVLARRQSAINRIEVIVNNTDKFNLELIEDIGSVVEDTFNARFSNILLKTYIRTIIKYAAADIASAVAYDDNNVLAWALIGIGGRIASDASEAADIRMSRYLPEKAHIGGINLDPGTYSVIINYYSGSRVVASESFDNIEVRNNRLNLIQSVNLN